MESKIQTAHVNSLGPTMIIQGGNINIALTPSEWNKLRGAVEDHLRDSHRRNGVSEYQLHPSESRRVPKHLVAV
jgi:hypothetical protein